METLLWAALGVIGSLGVLWLLIVGLGGWFFVGEWRKVSRRIDKARDEIDEGSTFRRRQPRRWKS